VLRYAITNRALFPGTSQQQQAALIRQTARWAVEGIDIIQLREKDLPAAGLAALARQILQNIQGTPTQLLINSRADIAIATSAHGVHLTSRHGELTPNQIRLLYASATLPPPVISVSCHTLAEVTRARDDQPSAILFAPIFEKSIPGQPTIPGFGLDQLHAACEAAAPIPIIALGGITLANAPLCQHAGAAGIAGIRLFHHP
jgi:thiamine-phosphate pyrophosphorylase